MTELLVAAARDPRLAAVYAKMLAKAQAYGLANSSLPFMAFASVGPPSKYGSWGHLEFTSQPLATAPKQRALLDFVAAAAGPLPEPGCLDPQRGRWATGEFTFVGPPAVAKPQAGDAWKPGGTYEVRARVECIRLRSLFFFLFFHGPSNFYGSSNHHWLGI